MGKLILDPSPTFTKEVEIHVPGKEPMKVGFEFKHKDKDELHEFLHGESAKTRTDIDGLLEVIKGWPGQDVEFNRDNLAKLLRNYHGAGAKILVTYVNELQDARLGN